MVTILYQRHPTLFCNIKVLLQIICTLPVTTCTAETSFSGFKRINTPFRSNMGNEYLSSLSLLHLHRNMNIKPEDSADEFAN